MRTRRHALPSDTELSALRLLAPEMPDRDLAARVVDLLTTFYATSAGRALARSGARVSLYLADRKGVLSGPYPTVEDAAEDVDAIAAIRDSSGPIRLDARRDGAGVQPRFKPSPTRAQLLLGIDLVHTELAVWKAPEGPVVYYPSSEVLARQAGHNALLEGAEAWRVALVNARSRDGVPQRPRRRWSLREFLATSSAYGDAYLSGAAWAAKMRKRVPNTTGFSLNEITALWVDGWMARQPAVLAAGAAALRTDVEEVSRDLRALAQGPQEIPPLPPTRRDVLEDGFHDGLVAGLRMGPR